MYEQIDGFRPGLTWFLRVPLGSGGPMYLDLGSKTVLCSSTWPLCTSTWALQTDLWSHETSKRPPGPILERFRTSPGGPGSPKTL